MNYLGSTQRMDISGCEGPPLISCIVPVFNGERYLREGLESIRAQTYRPLEIIVSDIEPFASLRANLYSRDESAI